MEKDSVNKIIHKLKSKQTELEENLEIIDILGADIGFNSDHELWPIARERKLFQTENFYQEMECIEQYSAGINYALELLEGKNGK